jgi:hypothetical protein
VIEKKIDEFEQNLQNDIVEQKAKLLEILVKQLPFLKSP